MSTSNGLADLLFGRTRGAVLALLYGHADQSFYTRQIAREVDTSVGAVQRELENLSNVGLILRKSVGSQVFYQANRDAPVFPEMRALVNKAVGVFSVLRSALRSLSTQIVVAFVYGSVAREEETTHSDVDLVVVGKATLDEVLSRLSTVEKSIGRPINPTVYSVAKFKSKRASGNHFLTAVLKGQKVFLLGDEDELRKVVEYGWLKREPASPGEIKDLLGIVERSLGDSKVEAVSTDLRFVAAFNAALAVATIALRASGHRPVTQAGHQVKTIESLELTVKANSKVIQRFKTLNNKRNKSVYDVAGGISDQELEAVIKLATELKDSTITWLKKAHPELLKG